MLKNLEQEAYEAALKDMGLEEIVDNPRGEEVRLMSDDFQGLCQFSKQEADIAVGNVLSYE